VVLRTVAGKDPISNDTVSCFVLPLGCPIEIALLMLLLLLSLILLILPRRRHPIYVVLLLLVVTDELQRTQ